MKFVRFPSALVAAVVVFGAGFTASRLSIREAHAQAAPFAASIYVPSDGLAFRTFDGRVVARLSYDAHGGMLDLYDEHEQPATRLRTDALGRSGVSAPSTPSSPRSSGDDLGF